MSTILTERFLPSELSSFLQKFCGFTCPLPNSVIVGLCSAAEPLALILRPPVAAKRSAPLIVWLPDIEPLQLFSLAGAEPLVENHPSRDLRTGRTYLIFRCPDAELEVRLDTWDLANYWATDEQELHVVFVGPGQVVAARHLMDADSAAALCFDLQAAASTTGPNWKPWRIYSEEELAEAEGREVPSYNPEIFVPRVCVLALTT